MLRLLKRARRHLFLRSFLRMLARLLLGLSLVGSLFLLLERLGLATSVALPWPFVAVAVSVLLLAGALLAWRLTPGLHEVARLVERRFGLDERLSTSLEYADRDDALAQALHGDAETSARLVSPARFAPPRLTPALSWSLLGSFALLLTLQFLPRSAQRPLALGASAQASDPAAADPRTDPGSEFMRQLLDQAARPTPTPERAAPEAAARLPGRGAGTPGATTTPTARPDATSLPTATPDANLVERSQAPDGLAAEAAPSGTEGAAATQPPAPSAPSLAERNDGSTNPRYDQASSRDQELREYARRREAGANPGGGGGDQAALADAAVAGDATAGYEGGAGSVLPDAPADVTDVELENVTDASGRRVTVERLPDAVDVPAADGPVGAADWRPADEPPVAREPFPAAGRELLLRYHQPADAPWGDAP